MKPRKAPRRDDVEEKRVKKKARAQSSLPSVQRTSERKEGLLNRKEDIIQELMVRWWYVLPDWPPREEDYG